MQRLHRQSMEKPVFIGWHNKDGKDIIMNYNLPG